MNFKNKVVWITGASSGIGRALALELSKKKARIILSSRNINALEKVKGMCKNPSEVHIIPIDLEDYTKMPSKVDKAIESFGKVDILFNNGGVSQRSKAEDTLIVVDKRIIDINYVGTIALTKALLPHFIANKRGLFVVTTSIVGKIGTPMRSSYAASKHALHGFFDSLRAEVHHHGLKVTLVCPGFVQTNVSKNALTGDGTPQQKMDTATQNGLTSDYFVRKMLAAVTREKQEVYIGGFKEKLGIYTKRFFPKLFSVMIRKLTVT